MDIPDMDAFMAVMQTDKAAKPCSMTGSYPKLS